MLNALRIIRGIHIFRAQDKIRIPDLQAHYVGHCSSFQAMSQNWYSKRRLVT